MLRCGFCHFVPKDKTRWCVQPISCSKLCNGCQHLGGQQRNQEVVGMICDLVNGDGAESG